MSFDLKTASEMGMTLNPIELTVSRKGLESCAFTAKEWQLLVCILGLASGRTFDRADVMDKVWPRLKVSRKVFDVHLSNVRKKICDLGIEISFDKDTRRYLIQLNS